MPPEADDPDVRLTQFLRGLTMGALVGAAIAGSAIWGRRAHRTRRPDRHDHPSSE